MSGDAPQVTGAAPPITGSGGRHVRVNLERTAVFALNEDLAVDATGGGE
jgi:hypothetical protein